VVAKGPSAAPSTAEAASREIAAPSALRALRAVASSASYDREAQRAMDLEGERFATLASEDMLARLPQPGSLTEGNEGGTGEGLGGSSAAPSLRGKDGEQEASMNSVQSQTRVAALYTPLA
jgi:hypothetical protein